MIPWWRRNLQGWRIGPLRLLSSQWAPDGRRWTIASYHHPKRMCWLWFLEFRRRWGVLPRVSRQPGFQAKTYVNLPFCTFLFVWQDQGRFTDPSDERMRKLAGVNEWSRQL